MAILIDRVSDTTIEIHDGATSLAIFDTNKGVRFNSGVALGAQSVKMIYGQTAVTGTSTVVTGLTKVYAVMAAAETDPDGAALAEVSAAVGDQAGAPAAGSVILKCWKVTTGGAGGNPTLIAATVAKTVNWIAFGL